jgi:hypothetical protein
MLVARVVDVSAVAQGDDVSHSGLVRDQSYRREPGESKLGEHAPVSCMPVTSGLIALDAKMKCYWRLIEDNQCSKGDEKRRFVSHNRMAPHRGRPIWLPELAVVAWGAELS